MRFKIYENGQLNFTFVKMLLVMFFIAVFFSIFVRGANLNCSIMPSSDCGETAILYLQNETGGYWNAHAENASEASYNYVICCDANDLGDTITTNCDDTMLLKLASVTNSHVQQPSVNTYSFDACISANIGKVSCNYPTTGCSSNYVCLASMASSEGDNTTNAHISNCSHYETSICCSLSSIPDNPSPILNSSDPTLNRTTQDLECSFVPVDDSAGESLYANITWFNNSLAITTNSSIPVTNGVQFVDILSPDYTTKHDNWTCSVQICDSTNLCSSWVNSSNLTILNTPPGTPTLSAPTDDDTTTNKTPEFSWSSTIDDDGDSLNYDLFIDCQPACSSDNRHVSGINGIAHTIQKELNYFIDDGDYYHWYVSAYDGEDYGVNTSVWTLNVQSQVILTLVNDSVDFSVMNIGDEDNTTDDSPSSLVIQNDGNCYIDANISADNLLWDTHPNPSSYFQYKIDNYTGEEGAFNWSSSVTTWTNIPVSNVTAISWFNYSDPADSARIDIKIAVPLDEPAGEKNSTMQLTGYYVKTT